MNHKFPIENIFVILVEPLGSANIGSVARAMKNMGFCNLILVNPKCEIDNEAQNYACSAEDILNNIKVHEKFEEAIATFHRVVGTSARLGKDRGVAGPFSPREYMNNNKSILQNQKIAFVFGRENKGLTNHELTLCNDIIKIPTSQNLVSINLAQSVMIILYECFLSLINPNKSMMQQIPAEMKEMEETYQHIETVLDLINFFEGREHKYTLLNFRRYLSKNSLTNHEVKILRGILHKIECKIEQISKKSEKNT